MKQDDATFVANTAELLRAHGYIVTPPEADPDEPATYSAAEAWEKMEQGWVASPNDGVTRWHMQGDGRAMGERDDLCINRHQTRDSWNVDADRFRFTLHGIHPKAHVYALQRLKAAGLKVGSVVEVVDVDGGETLLNTGIIFLDRHVGKSAAVTDIYDCENNALNVTADGYHYPAHCLRLVEPQPYTPPCDAPDGFEWAGECRSPRKGEWYQHCGHEHCGPRAVECMHHSDHVTRHILRKLPKTWKPGDKAWVEVEIVNGEPDVDGEVEVRIPRRGQFTSYTFLSALRETPGGGK